MNDADLSFRDIVLDEKEIEILENTSSRVACEFSHNDPEANHVYRLKHFGFVELKPKPGQDTNSDLFYAIASDFGKDYLAYFKDQQQKIKDKNAHDWKIAIFSSVGAALLSRPLWAGIDWIVSMIRRLLSL